MKCEDSLSLGLVPKAILFLSLFLHFLYNQAYTTNKETNKTITHMI